MIEVGMIEAGMIDAGMIDAGMIDAGHRNAVKSRPRVRQPGASAVLCGTRHA
jgi:hypothetical protein